MRGRSSVTVTRWDICWLNILGRILRGWGYTEGYLIDRLRSTTGDGGRGIGWRWRRISWRIERRLTTVHRLLTIWLCRPSSRRRSAHRRTVAGMCGLWSRRSIGRWWIVGGSLPIWLLIFVTVPRLVTLTTHCRWIHVLRWTFRRSHTRSRAKRRGPGLAE